MKLRFTVCWLAAALAAGVCACGQAELESFPVGTTTMVFSVMTEELIEPQALELQIVARSDNTYTVRMVVEATGSGEQLSGFGFLLGGAGLAYGGGQDVSLSPLQAVVEQRSRLQEGEEYLLPGGGEFTDVTAVTIAGVNSIEGLFVDPRNPNTRTTVALGVSKPVYTLPRVRVERLQAGEWQTVFLMELVEYAFVSP